MVKSAKQRGTPVNIALDGAKQKQFNQKVNNVKQKTKNGEEKSSGVVYLSRLPWGFEEKTMREYFKQFGAIKQIRVSRSKKTGNSKGYAYVQFKHDEVAKIVADTMNNYLMFGKLIKCRHLTNPHPDTFKNAGKKFFQPGLDRIRSISKHNTHKSEDSLEKSQKKMLAKYTKLQAKLAASGINYKLSDEELEKRRIELKEKAALKLAENQKNKKDADDNSATAADDDEESSSDDDDDSSADENEAPTFSLMGSVTDKLKKSVKTSQSVPTTPKSAKIQKKTSQSTGKRTGQQSVIPTDVDTPKGKRNSVTEDSSDEDIEFKTPPSSIKSSKLDKSLNSVKSSPAQKKVSPKRKNEEPTPKSSAKKAKVVPEEPVLAVKSTPKTPKTPKIDNEQTVSKSGEKELSTPKSIKKGLSTPKSIKKGLSTPKSALRRVQAEGTDRQTRSAKKTPKP